MVRKSHHSLREKIVITPSTLKMESGSSNETVVPVHQTTWHHMPSDCNLEVFMAVCCYIGGLLIKALLSCLLCYIM